MSRPSKVRQWKRLKMPAVPPRNWAIRWLSALHMPWEAWAQVSAIMKKNWMFWPKKPSLSRRKCWWKRVWKAGRKWNMKWSVTVMITASPFVIWRTLTRWAFIPESPSSLLLRRLLPMRSIINFASWLSASSVTSVSWENAMCNMRSTPNRRTTVS